MQAIATVIIGSMPGTPTLKICSMAQINTPRLDTCMVQKYKVQYLLNVNKIRGAMWIEFQSAAPRRHATRKRWPEDICVVSTETLLASNRPRSTRGSILDDCSRPQARISVKRKAVANIKHNEVNIKRHSDLESGPEVARSNLRRAALQ